MKNLVFSAFVLVAASASVLAQHSTQAIPVTVDNFIRAESDTYIGNFVKEAGGLGKFVHRREPASIDNQTDPAQSRHAL
jgi:hypothetical protein